MVRKLVALFGILVCAASSADAVTITTFPGSTFSTDTAAMDAALGISGATIEDFEDASLIPGLTLETDDVNPALKFGPIAVLPQLYAPLSPRVGELGPFVNNTWDGTHALVNGAGNGQINFFNNPAPHIVKFHVAGGTSSFGVGLANFQASQFITNDHRLFINDIDHGLIEDLPSYVDGVQVRNLYLRIDAEGGETIETVSIEISNNDGIVFDHLAIGSGVTAVNQTTWSRLKELYRD